MNKKKIPCATCQDLYECKNAIGLFRAYRLAQEVGEVKSMGLTCPKTGVSYELDARAESE